ncbi:MAG: tetratricopeptide repeat protein [Paraburkholderia sp.]|uniref:tetratricopeptide repeat protein n=1 Tax=Paraburkholderia sp. TaxID=1926495 RepID=UPI0011FE70CA|nr:tetratricopeptide repeat protein [Paraburkholderia sp.]TAL93623.1 MAG: tetratricopeptide repeat protein [Paraburkholderia sp.]
MPYLKNNMANPTQAGDDKTEPQNDVSGTAQLTGHDRAVQTLQTITHLTHLLDADPMNVGLHRSMSDAMRDAGNETGYLAHGIGIETFELMKTLPQPWAIPLFNVATVFFMNGDHESARRWYGIALDVDPDLAIAHQNLAAVHDATGNATEAQAHRAHAYRLQRIYVEPADNAPRKVLLLCTGNVAGNVPFDTLLPPGASYRIKYAIDYAGDAEDDQLPPFDLVFNAVGEPDIAEPLAPRIERFAQRCNRPLLNPPAAVARTRRDRLPTLLAGLDDVVVAPCILLETMPGSVDALADRLVSEGIDFPVLTRPLAKHGGEGLTMHASIDALWSALATFNAPHYLTAFHDFRSADGHFRKYRTVFVDRAPFPYHLAISSHWIVHYFSADMITADWKIDEERRFLQECGAVLGERAMNAIAAIGRRLDLDYGGIDFTLLPDGRVLVFEGNATMLVHREANNGVLAHKNVFVERIVDAFEQLQARRTGVA